MDNPDLSPATLPEAGSSPDEVETPRAFLRRATRTWHTAVEEAFAPYDLCTAAGLGGFLRAQAAATWPLERELDARGIVEHLPDWPSRRRGDALRADLDLLGTEPPADLDLPPVLHTTGCQVGALYVLEGSRMGGRLLAQRVAASPDPAVRAATTFLAHQAGRGAWAGFLRVLEAPDLGRDELLAGAEHAFGLFQRAATRFAP